MKKRILLIMVILTVALSGCANKDEVVEPVETVSSVEVVKPFSDLRYIEYAGFKKVYEKDEIIQEDIITYTFNEKTILKGYEDQQKQIMENGKNPGLGVRSLHALGITGKGVNVAIIDQNMLLDHPEFEGKIVKYYDTGCEQSENRGSMHGPAVTSILVGETNGVAPDANVYYAAAPSWKADSQYFADALYWVIDENKKLPANEKIHVVSVSGAPSGQGSPFTTNLESWDEAVLAAQNEGILVLDCRLDDTTGIIYQAFYDPSNPDDVALVKGGTPQSHQVISNQYIGVPTSYRTVAEEYDLGDCSYQYTGKGGLSWGIPYAAGVLALGWQLNPNLSSDEMIEILFETCTTANDGSNIIDPVKFIEAINKTLE